MTVNEIVDELRASRPARERRAPPPGARGRIPAAREEPVPPRPSPWPAPARAGASRRRGPRRRGRDRRRRHAPRAGRPGGGRSGHHGRARWPAPARRRTPARAPTPSAGAHEGGPGADVGRAQRYSATLALGVDDTDALSDATQRALGIVRDLGGFVVSARYATGTEGTSSLTLRVPSARPPTPSHASRRSARSSPRTSRSRTCRSLSTGSTASSGAFRPSSPPSPPSSRRPRPPAERARLTGAPHGAPRTAAAAPCEPRRDRSRGPHRDDPARAPHRGGRRPSRRRRRGSTGRSTGRSTSSPGRPSSCLRSRSPPLPLALVVAAVWATRRTRRRLEDERLLSS